MKNLILTLALFISFISIAQESQNVKSLKAQLSTINAEKFKIRSELQKKTEENSLNNPNLAPYLNAQLLSEYQVKEGKLNSNASIIEQELKSLENTQIREKNYEQQRQTLSVLKPQQSQVIDNYNLQMNRTINSLNSAGNELIMMQMQRDQDELKRRQRIANNFINSHNENLKNLTSAYNQIPKTVSQRF